jgi:hypothetical protein
MPRDHIPHIPSGVPCWPFDPLILLGNAQIPEAIGGTPDAGVVDPALLTRCGLAARNDDAAEFSK